MTVQLYDTRAQALRDFVPGDPENVTIYVCGPTVQSGPHIGHLRGALSFDILRRWLTHRFGRVTFVRNVTDIDDKVLANATDDRALVGAGVPDGAGVHRARMPRVGILPPTYEPRATASVPQMQEIIATPHRAPVTRTLRRRARVPREMSISTCARGPDYGSLTNQSIDAMEAAEDADPRGKRDPSGLRALEGREGR